MTDHAQTERKVEEEHVGARETWQNGLVTGIPGKNVALNGVLDLRGVPLDQVAGIESLKINGIVLMDEGNRNGLAGVKSEINGTVMVADPDLRVIMEPDMELSRAAVEAMPAGQKIMLVGNVFFKPDVPPELIAEKFERLHVVGIILACEGVYGALLGKMERTGVSITLPDDVAEVIRSIGENAWTQDYLSRLPEGTTYVNIGVTSIPDDVPEDLVDRKIVAYHNVGQTVAAEPIVALLKSRCSTNLGQFSAPEVEEAEEPEG
jgi:hypothetical protein